jgi:hypothetical protein
MQSLSQWWCEGESGAKIIYRQSLRAPIAAAGVSVAMLWLIPRFRTWYAVMICLYVTVMALAECRRAIIITDSSLRYRPTFGELVHVDLARILSVEKSTARVPSLAALRTRLSKGLRFTLTDGQQVVIPIDFPPGRDISRQFLKAP